MMRKDHGQHLVLGIKCIYIPSKYDMDAIRTMKVANPLQLLTNNNTAITNITNTNTTTATTNTITDNTANTAIIKNKMRRERN